SRGAPGFQFVLPQGARRLLAFEQARDCFGTATGPSSKRRFRYVINQSVNEFHTQLAAAALARPPDTRTAPDGVRLCNGILLSIPDNEYDVVHPHLRQVGLSLGQNLYDPLERLRYGYFVNEGIVSLFVVSAEARSVEVATVGKEGFVGAPLAAGINRSPYHAWARTPGVGL